MQGFFYVKQMMLQFCNTFANLNFVFLFNLKNQWH